MPTHAWTLLEKLSPLIHKAANAVVAMVTFYILKYIFQLPFHCTCSHSYDMMYMCAPPCIIFLLVFIIDKHQYRLFCGYMSQKSKHFNRCSFVGEHFLRLLLTWLFWMAAVFLDGDWYECHRAKNGTVCQNENLSDEKIQLNPNHRNVSLVIGLSLTMSGVGFWAVWFCCRMNCSCFQPYPQKLIERLKNIRETQRKGTENTDCDKLIRSLENAPEENDCLSECFGMFKKCKHKRSGSAAQKQGSENPTAPWYTTSCPCFDRSDIIESRDVSLFNRHLQKETEEDVERQIQELAKRTATIISKKRVRLLETALPIEERESTTDRLEMEGQPESSSVVRAGVHSAPQDTMPVQR